MLRLLSPTFRAYRHPVTIWVPPYAVAASKKQIMSSFDGVSVKDAITHLALQFWAPTQQGGVEPVKMAEVKDSTIKELRDWGHASGIRVMLCVYNGVERWDWPLARFAFADNSEAFVKNLIAEMDRLELDGIDIDLEGFDADNKNGKPFNEDKAAFVAFLATLSRKLHARGKHLTVNSMSYIWHAPNQTWWLDLFPLVDALNTMSYKDMGSNAAAWAAYSAQKKVAGPHANKLQIGMPSDVDRWAGNSALEQVQWLLKNRGTGMAIWDAQLLSSAWKNPAIWSAIRDISKGA